MIKELTKYIDNNLTTLTLGTNLFEGKIPPRTEGQAVVVERSDPGLRSASHGLLDTGQTPFNIIVRGAMDAGYFTPGDLVDSVFTLLHGKTQVTLPVVDAGATYLVNIGCNDPYYIGVDDKRRDSFILSVMVTRAEN